MARTACLVCLVSTVCGCHKNALGRASTGSGGTKQNLTNQLFLDIIA
jgi:hypothetical protein